MTVQELLEIGAARLPRRPGIPEPRREASWLLARALGVDELWLRLHADEAIEPEVEDRYRQWLDRRAAGEPAEHLTGRCTFWGLDFEVSPAVLVPRPETEQLVDTALALPISADAAVLDLGTGSGCLAVTLAAERPRWRVVAVDRSSAALAFARRNAARHHAAVELLAGDLGAALSCGFDLVVANLPYVPTDRLAELPVEVRHDPPQALDGGADGLDLIRRLLADLPRLLTPCGGAVLELGEDQADTVCDAAQAAGLATARRLRDLSGCERVVVLQRR